MNHLVIDFETMGKNPDCVVLSCALTFFNFDEIKSFNEYVENSYYFKFDIDHQLERYNRTIDKGTLDWWEKQDKEVKDSQFKPSDNDIELKDFICELKSLLGKHNITNKSLAFCRGQSFDFPILTNIVNQVKKEIKQFPINPEFFPVAFWNQRDIRSFISGILNDPTKTVCPLPKGVLDGFKKHDPVDDNARAILMFLYAMGYVNETIEIPSDDNIDPLSLR